MTNVTKTNETRLEVDLDALRHNFLYYKGRLDPDTQVMVMVKAASYGMGIIQVPRFLEELGADRFGVAFADEGVLLREAGIEVPIMVMNPGIRSFEEILAHDLEPLIYSLYSLSALEVAVKRKPPVSPVPVHLKMETGMNRLGIEEAELPEVLGRIRNNSSLEVSTVLSHLASSSRPENDAFTREQFRRFQEVRDKIRKAVGRPVPAHILNSAGISRFPEDQFDMVRLGIGLYGVPTTEKDHENIRNVCTFSSTISQIKHVAEGESVGYDRAFVAERDARVAIVPVGYGDGYSRHLGNGTGQVKIGGNWVPVVGNVCMDMIFADVTDVICREGSRVVLFDAEHSVIDIARQLDTIPYEVLTGISSRVKREYFQ